MSTESIELRRHSVHSPRTFLYIINAIITSEIVFFGVDHRKHVAASLHHLKFMVVKGILGRFVLIRIWYCLVPILPKKLLRIMISTLRGLLPANSVGSKGYLL